MDKYTVITQALKMLGEREYVEGSAVFDPANIFFESTLRECNARHHWSFARRVNVPLVPLGKPRRERPGHHRHPAGHKPGHGEEQDKPENAPERHEKRAHHDDWRKYPRGHRKPVLDSFWGVFQLPHDCMRIIRLSNRWGGKVPHWTLGVDVDSRERVIYTEGADEPRLTYTADILQAGAALPDDAPLFAQGVIHLLAARLAPSMLGNPAMGQQLKAQAEDYLREAILIDKRQERSNDQHPLMEIVNRDVLHSVRINSELYY